MIAVKRTSGQIEKERPSFQFSDTQDRIYSSHQITARLTEDIRNVLEEIRDKQMLQCDVRADRRMRIALEKIAKSLSAKRRKAVK